jgi:hypothetical protein
VKLDTSNFSFNCVNCENQIEQKLDSLIGKEWDWFEDFTLGEVEKIKEFYEMNAVGKSPDGGWTAVIKTTYKYCQTKYLIYAGVYEYSNSAYSVTLQGITEIIENE